MGYDTTIILNNDMLGDIEKDQNFGKMVAVAIKSLPGSDGPIPVGHGAYVIESHHMDDITVVAVGGRRGQVLGSCRYTQDYREILVTLAQRLGLVLMEKEMLDDLNKKPTLAEVREWAEMKGHRLVKNLEPDEPESPSETEAIDRILSLDDTEGTYEGPDRRKAAPPDTIPLDEKHLGELSEALLREKPKKMTLEEMNEYVKKTYGCRMIKLVKTGQKAKKSRRM